MGFVKLFVAVENYCCLKSRLLYFINLYKHNICADLSMVEVGY